MHHGLLQYQTGREGHSVVLQMLIQNEHCGVYHCRLSSTVPKVDKDGLQKALFDAVKRGPLELV